MQTFKKVEEVDGVVTFEQTFPEVTSKFTSKELESGLQNLLKKKKEVTAQKAFEKVKIDNIVSHHPHVLELSKEQANAVALYYQTLMKYEECIAMEEEVLKREEQFHEDVKKIKEETGYELVYPVEEVK